MPQELPSPARLNERGGPGPKANASKRRDPLAVRFDTAADILVRRAIARQGSWVPTWVPSPAAEFDDLDDGGLTYHERSFLQACYYHRLIYLHGPGGWTDENGKWHQNTNPDRTHALRRRWGPVQSRGRLLEVRTVEIGAASVNAYRLGWTS
jgi:hypothetical protein